MDDNRNAVMLVEAGNPSTDNRKDNRGSNQRIQDTNTYKASIIEFYKNESSRLNVT